MSISRVSFVYAVLSLLLVSCRQNRPLLPYPLYFTDDLGGISQVWRLEKDGVTRKMVTIEELDVSAFAISPADRKLALISDNKLILMDAKGRNRTLITEKQFDGSMESYYRNMITSPTFSPDGQTLAYGMNGIHLYNLSTGDDAHVLTNPENPTDDALGYATGNYTPVSWSPDGSRLLIKMSYYESYLLSIMDPDGENFLTPLSPGGAVCCLFTWTADGQSILAASPYFTGSVPGLWRFDAQTGNQIITIPGHDEEGFTNFVGWPFQSATGEITFFQARIENYPQSDPIVFSLVRANENGTAIQKLRSEEFFLNSALWSPDGTFVLIVGSWNGENKWLALVRPGSDEIKG